MSVTPSPSGDDLVRLTAWVSGQVQGVGFRWWTRSRALELGLVGYAANLSDGRVEVRAEGSQQQCDALVELLESGASRPGSVAGVVVQWTAVPAGKTSFAGFRER